MAVCLRAATALLVMLAWAAYASDEFAVPPERGFRHWLALRDEGLVRQATDYSCGLAALATILRYDYGQEVSEQTLHRQLVQDPSAWHLPDDWRHRGVSLATLSRLARYYGFEARGVAVSAATLARLAVPAIAYLEFEGVAHFTVIRGVTAGGQLHLADSSWGNRHMTFEDFLPLWRSGHGARDTGRLLLLRPAAGNPAELQRQYFRDKPLRALLSPRLLPPYLLR